ncbi:MAG: hypothetical protein JNK00_01900 [Flavipsychrobacter sp.]|nr:hypothetical protein [Flavipsychrobacter sp.]
MFSLNRFIKLVKPKSQRRSIENLLSLRLNLIPDYTFKYKATEVTPSGQIDTLYTKLLGEKEFELFDLVEVRVFGDFTGNKTVTFIGSRITSEHGYMQIESLINKCYDIYGNDTSYIPKGLFTDADRESLKAGLWSGRMWTGKNHIPGLIILMDNVRLELVIWHKALSY